MTNSIMRLPDTAITVIKEVFHSQLGEITN